MSWCRWRTKRTGSGMSLYKKDGGGPPRVRNDLAVECSRFTKVYEGIRGIFVIIEVFRKRAIL